MTQRRSLWYYISTHALREEGDGKLIQVPCGHCEISTHALREEGDVKSPKKWIDPAKISTHALREEGDSFAEFKRLYNQIFLPTPSARRATAGLHRLPEKLDISTHALREEGDVAPPWGGRPPGKNFYPRPPRGGRQASRCGLIWPG